MPILLITTIICVIILNYLLNKQNNSFHNTYKKELNETKFTKSKPFPESFFMEKSLNDYSFINCEKKSIQLFINNLKNMQNTKIVIPNESLSNDYLKSIYGENTLHLLSIYEHNYREYIYTLNGLAKVLIDNELYSDATKVLDEAIYCKSNMSTTYSLYFSAMKNLNSNYTLCDLMKNSSIKELVQNNNYILDKLNQL